MLALSSNAIFSGFGLIVSGWALFALFLLIGGLAALVFFKFRGKDSVAEKATYREMVKPRAGEAIQGEATVRPVRSDVSRSKAGQPGRNLQESPEINDLPIGQIAELAIPRAIDDLPVSEDEGLLAAIDEVQDDSDADSEFRAIALRVLAGFKTRNSIDALSQIALYDLSTTLRAKAVGMLADFDHQSVFEAIVLSCADPSREVRAAGARALSSPVPAPPPRSRASGWAGPPAPAGGRAPPR